MMLFDNEDYLADLHIVAAQLPKQNFSILITGATGLIGSFMADVLLYANRKLGMSHEIFLMSRSKKRLYDRFDYIHNEHNIHYVEWDVMNPFPKTINVDYIVNAASNADPHSYALYPAETILTNVVGTKNALEYARINMVKNVLLASTMEVYGSDIQKDSYSENDYGRIDFNSIRSGYPESKRVSELLCRSYVEEHKTPAVIARLGYIYGPTMLESDNKVIAQFIRNALKQEDIVLKSDGKQCRSYLYVADAVSAMFRILFEGKIGEAYNVSSASSVISIYEMANIVAKLGNCKVRKTVPDDLEEMGFSKPQNNVLCDEKLRGLGWKAKYDIARGIEKTLSILQMMD